MKLWTPLECSTESSPILYVGKISKLFNGITPSTGCGFMLEFNSLTCLKYNTKKYKIQHISMEVLHVYIKHVEED